MEINFAWFAVLTFLNLLCLSRVKMLQIDKPAYIRKNFTNTGKKHILKI